MKKSYKILSLLLIIAIVFSFAGCGNKNEKKIIKNEDPTPVDNEGKELAVITGSMNNKLFESDKYGSTYSIIIPEWEQLEDYNYENSYKDVKEIERKNAPTKTVETTKSYDFYTRAFKCKDDNIYLFVTEYLGNDKYCGADETYGETSDATASGVSDFVGLKCLNQYISKDISFEEYTFEPYKDGPYGCYHYVNKSIDKKPYYSKGYILTELEKPFLITVVDVSDSRGYGSQLDEVSKQIICSFSDSH